MSGSLLSAICQRWMIANGLPLAARHSTVSVVKLNGPKPLCAAGSFSAASWLRPTDEHHEAGLARAEAGADVVVHLLHAAVFLGGRRVAAAKNLGVGVIGKGKCRRNQRACDSQIKIQIKTAHRRLFLWEPDGAQAFEPRKLGKVRVSLREKPDIGAKSF